MVKEVKAGDGGEGQLNLMVAGPGVPWHPSLGSLPTPS